MGYDDSLGIKITGDASAKCIKIVRASLNLSMGDIKTKIQNKEYIYECDAVDDRGLAKIIKLYEELSKNGISCELYEHDRISSIDFFKNLNETYGEIGDELDDEDDF